MLTRLILNVLWAFNLAIYALILVLLLGGCATRLGPPCEPGTCSIGELLERTRDPFPAEPITFGSIFGPQPAPGRVTVAK